MIFVNNSSMIIIIININTYKVYHMTITRWEHKLFIINMKKKIILLSLYGLDYQNEDEWEEYYKD